MNLNMAWCDVPSFRVMSNVLQVPAQLDFAYGRRGCDRLVKAPKVVFRDRDSMVGRIEVLAVGVVSAREGREIVGRVASLWF